MDWDYVALGGELLGNGPTWLRKVHARMLGRSGDARAVAPLCAALRDEEIGGTAAAALAELGALAVPQLRDALKEGHGGVRWRAVEVLGMIGDASAVDALCAVLKDEDWQVRLKAAEALVRIRGPLGILPLCEALKHEGRAVRCWAAEALGRIMDPRAVQPLCDALEDKDWSVCAQVIKALRRIGDPRAAAPLVGLLPHVEWSLRAQVIEALGRIGDPIAAPPLIELLGHADWDVRWQAAGALEEIGHNAIRSLCQAIRHDSGRVREQAAAILGRIGDLRALLPLCGALQEGRLEAARALADLARRAPVAELEAALPLLCERAQYVPDGHEEGGPTGIARAAIQRLAAEGAAKARLPIPAAAPPPTMHGLPVPAGPPEPAVESLPVPAEAGVGTSGGCSAAQAARAASGGTRKRTVLRSWWQGVKRRLSER